MEQGKRTKEATTGSIEQSGLIGGKFVIQPNCGFIDERLKVYQSAFEQYKEMIEKTEKHPIKITLKDGAPIDGLAYKTTPAELLLKLPKKLQEQMLVAKVTYTKKFELDIFKKCVQADNEEEDQSAHSQKDKFEIIDLSRPLEGDCQLEFLTIADPLGLQTFYHSSAHILGQALEQYYGGYLCIGPPLSNGFYYDCYLGNYNISSEEFPKIEDVISKILAEKQGFERIVIDRATALQMFAHNPFKVQLISNKVPEGGYVTVYKCGKFIDLCTGPHLPSAKLIKAFKLTKNSSAYWLSKKTNDSLQRVYGISFPTQKEMEEYLKNQEELAKRDHRNIGLKDDLFMFHNFAPGSAFFYPAGALLYNSLVEFMRKQLRIRGYTEVVSPNLYDSMLWKTSGHWDKYQENMFLVKEPDATFGFKPMNCPGHYLMFDSQVRSYRELPIRYADFGVIHRNEVRGALSGLTRVVRFQQDDAHLFCTMDQVQDEILGCLDLANYVYTAFGFKFEAALATMPEKHIGDKALWDDAIDRLKKALNIFGHPYRINEGDGAFYGPKIDLTLQDAFGRKHQCGTVQVDFNGPIRFNLQYKTQEFVEKQSKEEQEQGDEQEDKQGKQGKQGKKDKQAKKEKGKDKPKGPEQQEPEKDKAKEPEKEKEPEAQEKPQEELKSELQDKEKPFVWKEQPVKPGFQRPVVIHRAIMGSIERFTAIICEETGGKFPFWISPRQLVICTINDQCIEFAQKVANRLMLEGYHCQVDSSSLTIQKKIRNATLKHFNFIASVGMEEVKNEYLDIRDANSGDRGKYTVDELIKFFKTKVPLVAEKEKQLLSNCYFRTENKELKELNDALQLKVYLEGEGYELGNKDKEVYQKLKGQHIDQVGYPNLFRWFNFVSKQIKE